MSTELTRRLLVDGVLQREQLEIALSTHTAQGVTLLRALLSHRFVTPAAIEAELSRSDVPLIRSVVPIKRLVERLPDGLCHQLLALPIREDPLTHVIDVAVADPLDAHIERELSFHLKAPVRIVRAMLTTLDEALTQLDRPVAPAPVARSEFSERKRDRLTPPYMERPSMQAQVAVVPQLRSSGSEIPIPLMRKSMDSLRAVSPEKVSERAEEEEIPLVLSQRIPVSVPRPSSSGVVVPRPPSSGLQSAPREETPLKSYLEAIGAAGSRDELLATLVDALHGDGSSVVVFAVRKGEFQGWELSDDLGAVDSARALHIPVDTPSFLATAQATGTYLGPLPRTVIHAPLHELLKDKASEVFAMPVLVRGKAILMLVIAGFLDALRASRRCDQLARAAGGALEGLLKRGG